MFPAASEAGGQLAGHLDPELVTDLLTSPLFYRRFVAHRPIPPGLVDEVIAHVLGGPHDRSDG